MTLTRKYNTYDADFVESFTNSDVKNTRMVSGQEDPSVTSYDAEVWYVETDSVPAYVVDISKEGLYEGYDPVEDPRSGTRETRLIDTYKCAMRLGAFVPTAVFGDGLWVMKEFDGESPWQKYKGEFLDIRDKMDVDALMWDCARMYILGYRDRKPQNMLVSETGEFRHIDLQAADSRVGSSLHLFTEGLASKVITLGFEPEFYNTVELRTLALVKHIKETGVLDPWITDTMRENMVRLENRLPIQDPGSVQENELPDVTDSIIPPAVPWSDQPFIQPRE